MRASLIALVALVGVLALAELAAAAPAERGPTCVELAGLAPSEVQLLSVAAVSEPASWKAAGAAVAVRSTQPFCRIVGRIEAEIGFELWLPPAAAWNGKFLSAGVGGEAGTYNYRDMVRGLKRGYATASTDAGHSLQDRDWAFRRPDRQANFGARANHLLALKAKELLASYYGAAPGKSYFVGCSGGGREGLKEVQAYPSDYDGVLAGGAGPDQFAASARLFWSQYTMESRYRGLLDDADWKLIADAGVAACDHRDGVADGVVEQPAACGFELKTLQCTGEKTPACLSARQIEVASALYAPLQDEVGTAIDSGVLPGVRMKFEPKSAFALTLFGKIAHDDRDWDPAQFAVARDIALARQAWPDLANDNLDIAAFKARGGKLIHYHGWLDPWILAQAPIKYFERVGQTLGETESFYRLFMVPGMGHCAGGPGTDRFGGAGEDAPLVDPDHDALAALEAWAERGRAPARIIASKIEDGALVRTRPLCPYPSHAAYKGTGSTDDAANFKCKE